MAPISCQLLVSTSRNTTPGKTKNRFPFSYFLNTLLISWGSVDDEEIDGIAMEEVIVRHCVISGIAVSNQSKQLGCRCQMRVDAPPPRTSGGPAAPSTSVDCVCVSFNRHQRIGEGKNNGGAGGGVERIGLHSDTTSSISSLTTSFIHLIRRLMRTRPTISLDRSQMRAIRFPFI